MKRIITLILALALLSACLTGCGSAGKSSTEETAFRKELDEFDSLANTNLNNLYFVCVNMKKGLDETGGTADGRGDELAAYAFTAEPDLDLDEITGKAEALVEKYKAVSANAWGKENAPEIMQNINDAFQALYGLMMCVGDPTGTADAFKAEYNGYEDTAYNALCEIEDYLKGE